MQSLSTNKGDVMKDLNIQETILDLQLTIDKLKEQLVYIINEDLNDYINFRIKYYQNIITWLVELRNIKRTEQDDLK